MGQPVEVTIKARKIFPRLYCYFRVAPSRVLQQWSRAAQTQFVPRGLRRAKRVNGEPYVNILPRTKWSRESDSFDTRSTDAVCAARVAKSKTSQWGTSNRVNGEEILAITILFELPIKRSCSGRSRVAWCKSRRVGCEEQNESMGNLM